MGAQGQMLVGEPGTAKSMLSELLAAAISGRSGLVVQGSAGTTEDHIRYSWNYALSPLSRALNRLGDADARVLPARLLQAVHLVDRARALLRPVPALQQL